MRIIGGEFKGRRLAAPRGRSTRPTTDLVREAVFSVLGPGPVKGARALDLFAGAGGLGLEALSRGAERVTLVELAGPALAALGANIATLGVESRARVVRCDLRRGLKPLVKHGPFDLVFMDPPYARGLAALLLERLSGSSLLAENTALVVEQEMAEPALEPETLGFTLTAQKTYGRTRVNFLLTKTLP